MNISSKIRELTAAGLSAEQVAERLKLPPWRVPQALGRTKRPGRPGGSATVAVQIQYAQRIAESAKDERARALALELLAHLQGQK